MRQLWERVKCAFLPDRRRTLVGINAVAVVAAALVLTGASGARSSSASARPVSGAAAQKQAVAAGIDIGAVVETAQRDVASAPETTSNPDIFAPPDLIVGESGETGHVDLTVTLSDQGDSQVSVHYTTADSTATQGTVCGNGADYIIASGTLIFEPGETTKTVPVQIVDCPNVEPFEAFTFNLSSEINGDIARASSRISIVDNDTIVVHAEAVRARRGRRREGRQRARAGLARRPRRPGLEQHGHRPLRDRRRHRERRHRLHRQIRHTSPSRRARRPRRSSSRSRDERHRGRAGETSRSP